MASSNKVASKNAATLQELNANKVTSKPIKMAQTITSSDSCHSSTITSEGRLTPSPASGDLLVGDSTQIPTFTSLDSINSTRGNDTKNSSLFSPLKSGVSDVSTSPLSSSLATSPILKCALSEYPETKPTCPPLENKSSLPVVDGTDSATATPTSLFVNSSLENTPQGLKEPTPKSMEVREVDKNATSDFQAEFIRRIVHDVENNLREVLRCRFGDLIIQSAQQFLTIQVITCLNSWPDCRW